MKIHTPIFVLGLLVFITPLLGIPSLYKMLIMSAFGVAIMIISSTINLEDLTADLKEISESQPVSNKIIVEDDIEEKVVVQENNALVENSTFEMNNEEKAE
jgi:hypothetical protein